MSAQIQTADVAKWALAQIQLSDVAKWALSVEVPWLHWKALENPTEIDLLERVHFLAWDMRDGEKELMNILCDFGVLDYMMEETILWHY